MASDLIAIGYWESSENPEFIHPRRLVGEYSSPETRDALVAYLESGVEFASSLGYSYCRFRCGVSESKMGCRDLTDGLWVWPEGLSHYVSAHSVLLPDVFVAHAESSGWSIADDVVVPPMRHLRDGSSAFPWDFEFWKQSYPKGRLGRVFGWVRQSCFGN